MLHTVGKILPISSQNMRKILGARVELFGFVSRQKASVENSSELIYKNWAKVVRPQLLKRLALDTVGKPMPKFTIWRRFENVLAMGVEIYSSKTLLVLHTWNQ